MAGVTGFFHGGITVKDMDKSLDFYRDGLGLSMKFDRILDGPYLNVVLGLAHQAIRRFILIFLAAVMWSFWNTRESKGLMRLRAPATLAAVIYVFMLKVSMKLPRRCFPKDTEPGVKAV